MIKNIRHAAIVVSDLEKCRHFYEAFFGFTLVKEDTETGKFIDTVVGLPDTNLHWVKLRTPNGIIIEILKYSTQGEASLKLQRSDKLGHSHLAFTVDNLDYFIKEFKAKKGILVNEPAVNPEGTAKVCYIFDPEGNILEMVEEL